MDSSACAQDVEMVQFMGKDNVPFHTVIFPATLLGTGDNWTMMRSISVTEYLNYEVSERRGVTCVTLLDLP
jgi:methionyl-tRNA synthetase